MTSFRKQALCGIGTGLLLVIAIVGCGSDAGQAEGPLTTMTSDQVGPIAGDGAPPVENLEGWKVVDGAIVVMTVTKSTSVPVDQPAPHRLYADQLVVRVDDTIWQAKGWEASTAADGLRLYGPLWSKTDDGTFVRSDERVGAEFGIGDRYVASVVPSLETAKDSWDIYLTDQTTAIPVVDGKLVPGDGAPTYQERLDGVSLDDFATMIADLAEPTGGP